MEVSIGVATSGLDGPFWFEPMTFLRWNGLFTWRFPRTHFVLTDITIHIKPLVFSLGFQIRLLFIENWLFHFWGMLFGLCFAFMVARFWFCLGCTRPLGKGHSYFFEFSNPILKVLDVLTGLLFDFLQWWLQQFNLKEDCVLFTFFNAWSCGFIQFLLKIEECYCLS